MESCIDENNNTIFEDEIQEDEASESMELEGEDPDMEGEEEGIEEEEQGLESFKLGEETKIDIRGRDIAFSLSADGETVKIRKQTFLEKEGEGRVLVRSIKLCKETVTDIMEDIQVLRGAADLLKKNKRVSFRGTYEGDVHLLFEPSKEFCHFRIYYRKEGEWISTTNGICLYGDELEIVLSLLEVSLPQMKVMTTTFLQSSKQKRVEVKTPQSPTKTNPQKALPSTSVEKTKPSTRGVGSTPNAKGESSIPSPTAKPKRMTVAAQKRHALFAKHQERMEKRKK
ncbi:MAG: hypothetical protein GY705_18635 [Bacteroidetes bacterium]|nr:hypothetical protein [Bacteroidota bacterium]